MKRLIHIIFISILLFGFARDVPYEIYSIIKDCIFIHADESITVWSEKRVSIVSAGDVEIKTFDGEGNRIFFYLPVVPGGYKKIKCSMWFNVFTGNVKATPVSICSQ